MPTQARIYENGLVHVPAYLGPGAQRALLAEIEEALAEAPLFRPAMPRTGKAFSVRMSNCGPLGWVSDRERGYRYQAAHPQTGKSWPKIPALVLKAWKDLAGYPCLPEACLINFYDAAARMGMHQDRDEAALDAPVLSLSLGSSCVFRFGGTTRAGKTEVLELASGDALLLQGAARLLYHGVTRLIPETSPLPDSDLLPADSRINLTLRRVTRPVSC
ncbi:MAG: alpha-ketoglutarate-dependent dioxygenase AlkB [Beijerinckiaceae bacterium]|nr:MAG: alpha-ketoglutarate-dependent dioxygenase AlkB [Beijerinckiaceae bacterium]